MGLSGRKTTGGSSKSGGNSKPPRGEWEDEIAEEEVMTLPWDMWQPAGTAAFYHLVRRAQQAPYVRYRNPCGTNEKLVYSGMKETDRGGEPPTLTH